MYYMYLELLWAHTRSCKSTPALRLSKNYEVGGMSLGLWTRACQIENITILVVTSCRYKIAFQNNREEFHLQHIVLQFYIPLNINFNFRTSYLFVS